MMKDSGNAKIDTFARQSQIRKWIMGHGLTDLISTDVMRALIEVDHARALRDNK